MLEQRLAHRALLRVLDQLRALLGRAERGEPLLERDQLEQTPGAAGQIPGREVHQPEQHAHRAHLRLRQDLRAARVRLLDVVEHRAPEVRELARLEHAEGERPPVARGSPAPSSRPRPGSRRPRCCRDRGPPRRRRGLSSPSTLPMPSSSSGAANVPGTGSPSGVLWSRVREVEKPSAPPRIASRTISRMRRMSSSPAVFCSRLRLPIAHQRTAQWPTMPPTFTPLGSLSIDVRILAVGLPVPGHSRS